MGTVKVKEESDYTREGVRRVEDMVVEEGILRSRLSLDGQVVIFTEAIPAWLLIVDGAKSESMFLYVLEEAVWFQSAMQLKSNYEIRYNWTSMLSAVWTMFTGVRFFLVQGSRHFCIMVLDDLHQVEVRREDLIVVVTPGRIPKALSLRGSQMGDSCPQ